MPNLYREKRTSVQRPELAERNRERAIPFDDMLMPEPNSGCFIWMGSVMKFGHGRVWDGDNPTTAHRKAWRLKYGPIPKGVSVLHRCDNPPCCNPDHLFLGTRRDNVHDMVRKGRNTPAAGERNSHAKLVADQIISIRHDGRKNAVIAKEYSVSPSTIWAIKARKKWKHI